MMRTFLLTALLSAALAASWTAPAVAEDVPPQVERTCLPPEAPEGLVCVSLLRHERIGALVPHEQGSTGSATVNLHVGQLTLYNSETDSRLGVLVAVPEARATVSNAPDGFLQFSHRELDRDVETLDFNATLRFSSQLEVCNCDFQILGPVDGSIGSVYHAVFEVTVAGRPAFEVPLYMVDPLDQSSSMDATSPEEMRDQLLALAAGAL